MGYGVLLIIGMTLISALFFFGAHVDNSSGEPAWVVRNMRLIGVGALVIGWVLGIALMRQAERDATIWEDRTEEYERKKEMDALKRDAKDIDKD
jgi:hypothetical protein|tara:strand:+ start:322 stop:603 length:282 start_codon:yes stop_codon:yes gene_type:complete